MKSRNTTRWVLVLTIVCIGCTPLLNATDWPVTNDLHLDGSRIAKWQKTRQKAAQGLSEGIKRRLPRCLRAPQPVPPVVTQPPVITLPKDELESRLKRIEEAIAGIYKNVPPYVSHRLNAERRVTYDLLHRWRAAAKRDLDASFS